jgi:uncharacterized DUF497 family protein
MFSPIGFEWDDAKARLNQIKHRVSSFSGARAFEDPGRVEWDVSRALDSESRWKVVGGVEGVLLVVVFTMRNETCRIISVRRVNTSEERRYGDRSLQS